MVDIASLVESSRLLDRWELESVQKDKHETVARSLISYRHLKTELQSQCISLSAQQERLDEESSSAEPLTVWVMGSWGALESVDGKKEDAEEYSRKKRELTKEIVMLKIQVLCLKQVHVSSCIKQLQIETGCDPLSQDLITSGSKAPTPEALQFCRFEEWVQGNQQLYKLQSKMLDLEAAKIRLHKEFCIQDDKELSQSSASSITTRQSFASHLEKKLGSKEPDITSGELNLEEVVVSQGSVQIASFLDRILDTSHVNSTFEACKLKAYIRECWDVQNIDDEFPTGVHPDRYQEFVGGMAQYIIDKQLTHQRESLSYDMVYAKIEQYLLPSIYNVIQAHIRKPEEDKRISQIYKNLAHITQTQFGISPVYQDDSIAPYYAAVACMKSMALSILPSRKIHAIVGAAHCVFRKLNELSILEHSKPPGADEFMDVWVYVVLKSRIPNLASTIAILRRYSNPNLAFSEAGYYLSSVEFACQYLVRINEQDYRDKSHLLTERLVVCEQTRFGKMAREEAAVFEIVSQDKWLQGFEVFAVKEWHLDPTRFYRTVLVPSLDANTKVKVSVVKVRPENTSFSQLEMLEQVFMCPGDENGLSCTRTNHGIAVTLNVDHVRDELTLIPIPDGDYDVFEDTVTNFATLDKLACDYNPPSRIAPAEIVLMTTALETMQKMEDIVSSTYSIPKTLYGAVRNLIGALIRALRQLSYLSSLFDTPEVYSALIQSAVQKFQTDYNKKCQSSTSRLPSNGLLCPSTWAALQNSIGKVTKTATPN